MKKVEEVFKITYQKVKDLENIKKNMKDSVLEVQHLVTRKPKREQEERKKKGRRKTTK